MTSNKSLRLQVFGIQELLITLDVNRVKWVAQYPAILTVSVFASIEDVYRHTEPWISVICSPSERMIKFLGKIGLSNPSQKLYT